MTSAEKIAELRRLFQVELARGRDPQLVSLYGAWRMCRPFVRRPLERVFADVDLEDVEQLDGLLGLIAGMALELRSDPELEPWEQDQHGNPMPFRSVRDKRLLEEVRELRAAARALLERVVVGELEEPTR